MAYENVYKPLPVRDTPFQRYGGGEAQGVGSYRPPTEARPRQQQPAPAPAKPPAGMTPYQAWEYARNKSGNGTGVPTYADWVRPDSAGKGLSYYQLYNRTGDFRPKTNVGNVYGQQGASGNINTIMDPLAEARTQADVMRQERQRALDTYVSGQRAALQSQIDPAFEQVNQAMADRGIYHSTGAGTALGKVYGQIASPILNNISNAQADFLDFGKNLGTQEAALYSQLARSGRDEFRADRAFNAGQDQFNKQLAADLYNTLYAGALGRGQIQQNFDNIEFPGAGPGTTLPAWMNAYYRYAAPKGDPIEQGSGPIGDAGEKAGPHGGNIYNIKSYARERASADDSYRNASLALASKQEERLARAQEWQQKMAEAEVGGKDDNEFTSQLLQLAWTPSPKSGILGAGTSLAAVRALASAYGKDINDYLMLLSPHLRDQLRQEAAGPQSMTALKPMSERVDADPFFRKHEPEGWIERAKGVRNNTWSAYEDVGPLAGAGRSMSAYLGGIGGDIQDLWTYLFHGKEKPKYNF